MEYLIAAVLGALGVALVLAGAHGAGGKLLAAITGNGSSSDSGIGAGVASGKATGTETGRTKAVLYGYPQNGLLAGP